MIDMKRALLALGLILVSLFGVSLVAPASPAQAADECQSGYSYICFYDATSPSGMLEFSAASIYAQSRCYPEASSTNNKIGYIWNNTSATFNVYDSSDCSGTGGIIYAHSKGAMNSQWNNKISSIVRLT